MDRINSFRTHKTQAKEQSGWSYFLYFTKKKESLRKLSNYTFRTTAGGFVEILHLSSCRYASSVMVQNQKNPGDDD